MIPLFPLLFILLLAWIAKSVEKDFIVAAQKLANSFLISAYRKPYILSYSDRGMDIFDVNTAKWIQTLHAKKVKVLMFFLNFQWSF